MKSIGDARKQVNLKNGDKKMSSEEIRLELESFINRGLKERWHGWPVKRGACTAIAIHELRQDLSALQIEKETQLRYRHISKEV